MVERLAVGNLIDLIDPRSIRLCMCSRACKSLEQG